jgi:hypothetical protein
MWVIVRSELRFEERDPVGQIGDAANEIAELVASIHSAGTCHHAQRRRQRSTQHRAQLATGVE